MSLSQNGRKLSKREFISNETEKLRADNVNVTDETVMHFENFYDGKYKEFVIRVKTQGQTRENTYEFTPMNSKSGKRITLSKNANVSGFTYNSNTPAAMSGLSSPAINANYMNIPDSVKSLLLNGPPKFLTETPWILTAPTPRFVSNVMEKSSNDRNNGEEGNGFPDFSNKIAESPLSFTLLGLTGCTPQEDYLSPDHDDNSVDEPEPVKPPKVYPWLPDSSKFPQQFLPYMLFPTTRSEAIAAAERSPFFAEIYADYLPKKNASDGTEPIKVLPDPSKFTYDKVTYGDYVPPSLPSNLKPTENLITDYVNLIQYKNDPAAENKKKEILEILNSRDTSGGPLKQFHLDIIGKLAPYTFGDNPYNIKEGWTEKVLHPSINMNLEHINSVLKQFGITDPKSLEIFMANVSGETGFGKDVVQQWSDSFYKGSGGFQLTTKAMYEGFADYMNDPKIVEEGATYVGENYFWEASAWVWSYATDGQATPKDHFLNYDNDMDKDTKFKRTIRQVAYGKYKDPDNSIELGHNYPEKRDLYYAISGIFG